MKTNKIDFKWNVWIWDFNHDKLESYDVVPLFIEELKKLKKSDKPKTKEEFSEFIKKEAKYYFWGKCEFEMIIHGWPKNKNNQLIDVYNQLELNWDTFVDCFWNSLNKQANSDHRKQRGRTAPNNISKKGLRK